MKQNKTAPLSIRITPDLKAELQKLADADKRPLASYVEIVLETHVAAQGKKTKRQ